MADLSTTYAVKMTDEIKGPAGSAADALAALKAKLDQDTAALRQMQASMRALKGGTSINVAAFKDLRAQIGAQKEAIAAATTKYVSLGGTFEKIAKPAEHAKVSLDKVQAASSHLSGPLGTLAGTVKDTAELLGQGGLVAGAGLAVTAILVLTVAITAAAVGALVSLMAKALAAGDALRDMSADLEAAAIAAKNFKASGDAMSATVANVASHVPIAREQVAGFAKQLAGIKGDNFAKALEAVSTLGSVGGDTGKLVASLNAAAKAGQNVSHITDKIQAQYGDLAKAKMLDVNVQFAKAKENITGLFAGVKIEAFEKALKSILDLFSQNTASGKALKTIVESMLNPLFGAAAKGGPILVGAFKQGIIWALKLAIAVYATRNKIADLFGVKHDEALVTGLKAIATVAGAIASAFLTIVPGGNALAGIFLVIRVAIAALTGAFGSAVDKAKSIGKSFLGIGGDMVSGLVSGIKAGATKVVSAITGVVGGAISAAKKLLHIASPSKVFADIGKQTGAGMAGGVESSAPKVGAAVDSMIAIPSAGGSSGASRGGAGSFVFAPVISVNGGGNSQDIADQVRAVVEDEFEKFAAQLGAEAA